MKRAKTADLPKPTRAQLQEMLLHMDEKVQAHESRANGLQEQVENLNAALQKVKAERDEALKNGIAWRDQVKAAEKARDEANTALAAARSDCSRLEGYLDRVLEDDAIRDGSAPRQPEMGATLISNQPEPRRGPRLSERGMRNW